MKNIIVTVIVLAVVGGGAFLLLQQNKAEAPTEGTTEGTVNTNETSSTTTPSSSTGANTNPSGSTTETTVTETFTMAQVATHNSASSCWSVIRGGVFDLTSWISKHPGGSEAIVKLCGKDGTEKFVDKHGGSSQQENQLAEFRIGDLAQ